MKLLSATSVRIIGCLIEKSLTTPDQYPLSVNALANACNQKSNREPVLSLGENAVLDEINTLVDDGLVREETGFGSRVAKYRHRFCNTEFSELKLSAQELGVICVMFLRGPQTSGELRTRTNRLCSFAHISEVEQTLQGLQDRALVVRLAREPGKREARFAHLFSGDVEALEASVSTQSAPVQNTDDVHDGALLPRMAQLEDQIKALTLRVTQLEEER